ncbi:pilus assembly protein TadG-related protein [Streptomonospora wellingtoniae]|uniref:Pilus assembly protein TadG-related protein n=1 Tax=Streptomonospora wellingtoniae TaxID=3075544 RepID=A0ABU2KXT0_9ACTN|nr:pilus assembly protein TadG-related protein [Streptomonospora sp. DSM 45055]MDT0304116.1 pilus assembly protein TadG-related protein [Streptomonospora sp. DSM 45055]
MTIRTGTCGSNRDSGQANLFMLIGLTISLIAILLLFVRVGNANNLRSDAQTAADASALAAAGVARDHAARALADDEIPYSRLYDPAEGRTAAEHYAAQNGATVEQIRASDDSQGNVGNIVRVEIQTKSCQRELQKDGSRHWSDAACTESDDPDAETSHSGNASAIAEVVMPECEYAFGGSEIVGLTCDGEQVQGFAHAQQLIDVRLTDSEGKYIYKPLGNALAFAPSRGENPS